MVTIQNFDPKHCEKINCPRLSWWYGGVCYGDYEHCNENNKNGFPKEMKK